MINLNVFVVLLAGSPERGRVPAVGPGRGGAALGPAQTEAQHELRQAVARAALLLRQEHHEQGTTFTYYSSDYVTNHYRHQEIAQKSAQVTQINHA